MSYAVSSCSAVVAASFYYFLSQPMLQGLVNWELLNIRVSCFSLEFVFFEIQGHTKAESPPHSVVILDIVDRVSISKLATPGPVNSTAWLRTSSLNKEHNVMITSLPVTPSGSAPRNVTRAIGGICHHVRDVACCANGVSSCYLKGCWKTLFSRLTQILAASVRTTGVPRQPTAP